jgi:hypothetical protein
MKKLGLKLLLTGWIAFGISFIVVPTWHDFCLGISYGIFFTSLWVNFTEYKNQ